MSTNKTKTIMKIIVALTFLLMLIVNILSTTLPINGVTPGEVSDSHPNLFAPAGITFAIWGVIYLLLAMYTLYQIGLFQKDKSTKKLVLMEKVGLYFFISSIANAAWIFAWHYNKIPLSLLLMIVILVCLILINRIINPNQLSLREKFFIRLPFSVYFGWITVATIANVTTLLVSIGWNGFGISEPIWAIIMVFVGMMIGIATILKNKDIAYGLVLIWAYVGILIKHISDSGFSSQYPAVIITVIICIILFFIAEIYTLYSQK